MSHNKDKKFVTCKQCGRKRYCTKVSVPNHNFKYTCNKGHYWIVEGVTAERVAAVMNDVFNKDRLRKMFDRSDIFFRNLKG